MRLPKRALMYAGVALIVAGFAVIGFIWGEVAALTAVPLQLPYFVSGGLTSLGLIMVGVTLINIQIKLTDAHRRDRQLTQLSELLEEIRLLLGGEERPDADGPGDVPDTDDRRPDDDPQVTSEMPLREQPVEKVAGK